MASRKRRMVALAAGAEQTVSLDKHCERTEQKPKESQTTLTKQLTQPESAQSTEAERSRYFTQNEVQLRLGEDFFNQPCIRLAKAFLGQVRLPSHCFYRLSSFCPDLWWRDCVQHKIYRQFMSYTALLLNLLLITWTDLLTFRDFIKSFQHYLLYYYITYSCSPSGIWIHLCGLLYLHWCK